MVAHVGCEGSSPSKTIKKEEKKMKKYIKFLKKDIAKGCGMMVKELFGKKK